jgi:hypothetical protein
MLRALRDDVKDIFNKGVSPGQDIMEELWFLAPETKDVLEKMSLSYNKVVTPQDFKLIAKIMSENLAAEVPILKDFTRYFGRLAEDFLVNAKPSKAAFDWKEIAKQRVFGDKRKGYVLPDWVNILIGVKPGEPVSENILKRFKFYNRDTALANILYGVPPSKLRRMGVKWKIPFVYKKDIEFLQANKMPKSWTNVPWVNFDGKTIEQNFTQVFEERIIYKDKFGDWQTNILQIPQKTEATWWEQVVNKSGKINDIANATKARTAFAVNGNHSNDATLVKRFHLWGRKNKVSTSTIHDAFFGNIADMTKARRALRELYAESLNKNVIRLTLDEMRARGLPKDLYDKYLKEAIDLGLIPEAGKSVIDGQKLKESDILKIEDILEDVKDDFSDDYGWYGVG